MSTLMKTTILRWASVTAAALSSIWVVLLAALVMLCKQDDEPFPVLAKFSPFHGLLMLVDRWLTLSPAFALLTVLLIGATWYSERSFRSFRTFAVASAMFVSLSLLVMVLNPGGYVSWFLS